MMEQILLIFCTFDWWLTERGKRKESKLGQQFAFRSARFVTRLEMRKILPAEIRLLFYHFALFILSVLLVIILKYILTKANSKVLTQLLKANQKIGPYVAGFKICIINVLLLDFRKKNTNDECNVICKIMSIPTLHKFLCEFPKEEVALAAISISLLITALTI